MSSPSSDKAAADAESTPIRENAWVVLADGHGARVLVNAGQHGELKLREHDTFKPQHGGGGPGGSRPQGDAPRDTEEATFAKQLAQWLYEQAHAGAFQQLVLAADPTTLGQLRPQLHVEVTRRIVRELPKTLVALPVAEVVRSIQAG